MSTSENLSGETRIVRRTPLVHGQSVGCNMYTPGSRLSRPCTLKLTHTISLPERESLPNEALNDDIQGRSSTNKRAGISDPGSRNTKGYNSTTLHSHNLFLLELEVNEAEKNCDTYANNLHKYLKEYPFCQYGNSNGTEDQTLRNTTACNHNLKNLEHFVRVTNDEQILPDSGLKTLPRNHEDTPILMDCGEQDWADGYVPHITNAFSDCESFNQNQVDYISDSSCNSSDGVLVNFSAIYNKTNNAVPATPHDLDSPAREYRASESNQDQSRSNQDDDFKLIPCWTPSKVDPNCNIYQADCNGLSSQETSDLTPGQGQLTTYTNNYYKLVTCDLSSQSAASPAWSSLTSCSEASSHGSTTPPTEYFLFGKPETEDREMVEVNQRDLKADEDTELNQSKSTNRKKNRRGKCNKTHDNKHKDQDPNSHEDTSATPVSQSWNKQPCHSSPNEENLRRVLSCPSQISLTSHVLKQHKTSFAELARSRKSARSPSVPKNSKEDPTCSHFSQNISHDQMNAQKETLITNMTGKESEISERSETAGNIPPLEVPEPCLDVAQCTKPQRPTSLPIQPFVLQPSGKQSSNILGSLIDHYMNQKHGTSKSSDTSSHLASLPSNNYTSIHLEVASCSATCSTCTPTPNEPHIWPHWAPPCPLFLHTHPDLTYRITNTLESSLTRSPGANHTCLDQTYPTLNLYQTGQEKSILKPLSNNTWSYHPDQAGSHRTSQRFSAPQPRRQEEHISSQYSSSPAITSDLTSLNILNLPGVLQTHHTEELNTAAFAFGPKNLPCFVEKEQHQHGDSSSLADRPPEEFCSSPDPSTKSLPIDLLQWKDLLKSLSIAVDSITAHFGSCTDPNEKFRLGNSSLCPRISRLVLDQLCPAFRNILQDGLRPFKLDLIVGRRSNKPWNVVEASTQPGPSTRMLHSLVSVVKKCSKLINHNMRLNAFFLGLLNLSALESWFLHLHTCVDVVAEYYHPWAFLALSQDPACKSIFQDLLLLLQPLAELPFDLHLLSEARLQRRQERNQPSIQQSSFSALSGCSFLKMPTRHKSDGQVERSKITEKRDPSAPSEIRCSTREAEQKSSVCSKKQRAGWWLSHAPFTEHVTEAVPHGRHDETLVEDRKKEEFPVGTYEVKPSTELRWARLFGSGIGSPVEKEQRNIKQTQRIRPPSQWLQLGAWKMDQLAKSVWSKEMSRILSQTQTQQRPNRLNLHGHEEV